MLYNNLNSAALGGGGRGPGGPEFTDEFKKKILTAEVKYRN